MYDVQYDGPRGWTLYKTQPTEGDALLAALSCARAFHNGSNFAWRVVSPDAAVLWCIKQDDEQSIVTKG